MKLIERKKFGCKEKMSNTLAKTSQNIFVYSYISAHSKQYFYFEIFFLADRGANANALKKIIKNEY